MKNRITAIKNGHFQRGVVLVVALVMLLVMTLIGITTMTSSTLQERMAGNNRQLSVARLEAEAALRQAEQYLANQNFSTSQGVADKFTNEAWLYVTHPIDDAQPTPPAKNPAMVDSWKGDDSISSQTATGMNSGDTAPRYIVEYLGKMKDRGSENLAVDVEDKFAGAEPSPLVFRITAVGYGQNPNIVSILQSTYATQQGVPGSRPATDSSE